MDFEKHFSDDGGRQIEWGRTAQDYAEHRPDYPDEFYRRLADRGIGVSGQRILDLGTGVGFLAQKFAEQGADVVGIDIDAKQLAVASQRAQVAGLHVEYREAPAEKTGLPDARFHVVTASQCWLYFDRDKASREVKRLLRPHGRLATCHLCWLPREDDVARRSEELAGAAGIGGVGLLGVGASQFTGQVTEEFERRNQELIRAVQGSNEALIRAYDDAQQRITDLQRKLDVSFPE